MARVRKGGGACGAQAAHATDSLYAEQDTRERGRREKKEKERKKKSTTPKNGLKESKKQTSSPRIAAKEQSAGCDVPFCNSNYCTHCSNAQRCTNTRLRRHCSLHHVYFLWALDLFRIRGLRGRRKVKVWVASQC